MKKTIHFLLCFILSMNFSTLADIIKVKKEITNEEIIQFEQKEKKIIHKKNIFGSGIIKKKKKTLIITGVLVTLIAIIILASDSDDSSDEIVDSPCDC
ncbi:hypothetical protein BVX93_01635 [bacterium B13(2017)]|nr:hypothetical protein BVX93_01635 [bacterium B13(2017)]